MPKPLTFLCALGLALLLADAAVASVAGLRLAIRVTVESQP